MSYTDNSANTLPDSIQTSLKNASEKEKLEIWKKWYKTLDNNTDPYTYLHTLDQSCQEATNLLPKDSAIQFCFERKIDLIKSISTYHQYNFTAIDSLLKESKILADSMASINGTPHALQIIWHLNYGEYYGKVHQDDKALEQFQMSFDLSQKLKDPSLVFIANKNLAYIYSSLQNFEKAEEHVIKAEASIDKFEISSREKINFYFRTGNMYGTINKPKKANFYLEKMMEGVDDVPVYAQRKYKITYWRNLADLGQAERVFKLIKPWYEEGLVKGNEYDRMNILELYTTVLVSTRQFDKLAAPTREYRNLVWEDEKLLMGDDFFRLSTSIETSEKEAQLKTIEQEQAISQSRFKIGLLTTGIIGVLALGGLFFNLQRNKSKRAQLAVVQEKEKKIIENRNRLFSSITHDIRTPLALMMAPIERARKKISDPNALKDLDMASRNGRRLMNLFTQILDWNKVESEALFLNPQVGELNVTFPLLAQRFRQQAFEKDILFTQNIDVPSGQFKLDYDKLDKILTNLMNNAVKFCKSGSEIILNIKSNNNHSLLDIEFKDNGPGIPDSEKSKIFDRYFIGHLGKDRGGTGIGLALVKELTEIMIGKVSLDSTEGKGTAFNIQLPVQFIQDKVTEEVDSDIISSNETEKPLVLVVEDEPELLEFIQSSLVDKYEVAVANSTTIGWSIAQSQLPDIIISDWNLPDENGGWLCKKVKTNPKTNHIPILILTANNSDLNQKEAFDSGAFAWMSKPFVLETLLKQLESILNQQKQIRQTLKNRLEAPETETDETVEPMDPFVAQVLDLIEKNYTSENYSVDQLATDLEIHRVQLSRALKKLVAQSPSFLIKDFRLKKAKKLLKSSDQSISEIAYAVGFSNPNYFATAYKKHFEISPSQERGNQ